LKTRDVMVLICGLKIGYNFVHDVEPKLSASLYVMHFVLCRKNNRNKLFIDTMAL
jgi:hypothetical protein